MPNKSSDWVLNIPTGSGAFDCFLPVACGDVLDVQDVTNGQLDVIYQTDVRTGRHYSIAHVRTPNPSEMNLQVTEEGAGGIDRLRDGDCMIPIQRRLICKSDWSLIEHYSRCRFGERSLLSPTAGGIETRDDVPSVQVPVVFDGRFIIDKQKPYVDFIEESKWEIVDISYCDDNNCGYQGRFERPAFEGVDLSNPPSDGCDIVFRLYRNIEDDEDFRLDISRDSGRTWETVYTDMTPLFAPNFMHCYFGRVFIGFGEEVYYSDFPTIPSSVSEPTEWIRITGLNEPHQSLAGGTITILPPAEGAFIVKMVSVDHLLAILYNDGDTQNGIAIAPLDHGVSWETTLVPSTLNGFYSDIDITGYGSVIVACGKSFNGAVAEIAFNYQRGKPRTSDPNEPAWFIQQFSDPMFGQSPNFIAIDISTYNPHQNRTVFSYIWNEYVGENGDSYDIIYKSKEMTDWQEVYRKFRATADQEDNVSKAHLSSHLDSWLVWGHRNNTNSFGDSVTIKSADGGCNWINMNKETKIYSVNGCLVTDPATGILILEAYGIQNELSPLSLPTPACIYVKTSPTNNVVISGDILIFDPVTGTVAFQIGSPIDPAYCTLNKILSIALQDADGNCPAFEAQENLYGQTAFDVCEDNPNKSIISGVAEPE